MQLFKVIFLSFFLLTCSLGFSAELKTDGPPQKKLAYLVSDQRIPFWDIMWRGIMQRVTSFSEMSSLPPVSSIA